MSTPAFRTPVPVSPDPLLATGEVARLLAQAEQTLRNWRCDGKGPAFVKIGRSVRYRTSAVVAFVDALDSVSAGEVAA